MVDATPPAASRYVHTHDGPLSAGAESRRGGDLGPVAIAPFLSPGRRRAVARLRLPQNVACGFPALRFSDVGLQNRESLQRLIAQMQL
jgi:hypothetical protein